MAVPVLQYTTGPATLGDDSGQPGVVVGNLSYNGCVFGPLVESSVNGVMTEDAAGRTVKYVDYMITVDGYVTAPEPARVTGIAPTMATLYNLLSAQGGSLVYKDRAHDLIVNPPGGGGTRDVAWGPVPKVLDFQPLGGGNSAKIKWQVQVRIPEVKVTTVFGVKIAGVSLLQFNYETSLNYGEDGYSSLSMRGTLEIPLTRATQATRTVPSTADDVRAVIEARLMAGIDLSRFYVSRRNFNVSRDKRTLEWDWAIEEKPYMDCPPDCTIARGSYSVRPSKVGPGLAMWMCTLRATYTVRKDRPRRVAWWAFLTLLYLRMSASKNAPLPSDKPNRRGGLNPFDFVAPQYQAAIQFWRRFFAKQKQQGVNRPILIDFSIDEGLYRDSKTVSFSATWKFCTTLTHVLIASGLWKKVPESNGQGNVWAISMKDVSGSQSWLANPLDPALDVIVDFGGG